MEVFFRSPSIFPNKDKTKISGWEATPALFRGLHLRTGHLFPYGKEGCFDRPGFGRLRGST